MSTTPLLAVENLSVGFATAQGEQVAVRDFSLTIAPGECIGIVGESGAGKSQAFLAIMGLLAANGRAHGHARFQGTELIGRRAADLDQLRGSRLSMIFQNPMSSLTPHLRVGDQIAASLVKHRAQSWRRARQWAQELLHRAQLPDPAQRARQYPHELSGGMRQRVMIALALACDPALLIADEPTTALDVTVQGQILALLAELKRTRALSLVLIAHDLGVVAGLADRIIVMEGGGIVEAGTAVKVLKDPAHPYTQALLDCIPRIDGPLDDDLPPARAGEKEVLASVSGLRVQFRSVGSFWGRRAAVRALDGVDLEVLAGDALGIVGESGCGKSTLARALLALVPPTAGRVLWSGHEVTALRHADRQHLRRQRQMVFQDPFGSLDPRMSVGEIVAEPLRVHCRDLSGGQRGQAVEQIIERVGLSRSLIGRYPHELSGGQCQRVGIARAMVLQPRLLICDEAVSALDASTQAQVVALLKDLKQERDMALVFISHNLAVVRQLCARVLVLYAGRMLELAPAKDLYTHPLHPYTRGLLESIPVPDPGVQAERLTRIMRGEPPAAATDLQGCVFRARCPYAIDLCARQSPPWETVAETRHIACHRWRELSENAILDQ